MRKSAFGLFGLLVLLGNQLGSSFGMAVAICVFMVVDGLLESTRRRPHKRIMMKKEDK